MIKIRKNVFETNSSSTHSLVLEKDFELTSDQIEFLKNLDCYIPILPSTDTPEDDFDVYDTIYQKLSYLYTTAVQDGYVSDRKEDDYDNYSYFGEEIVNILTEVCPNVKFEKTCSDESYYRLEDLDYLASDTDFNLKLINNKDNLIKFLLKGKIYNLSRDYNYENYDLRNKVRDLEDKVKNSYIGIEVSG